MKVPKAGGFSLKGLFKAFASSILKRREVAVREQGRERAKFRV